MVKSMFKLPLLIVFFYGILISSSHAASLVAELDRNEIEFGQSVTLSVTASDLDGEIDFGVLSKDFEVLDTSRSKNVQIVNGKMNASLTWRVALMPLNSGTLTVPAFSIGKLQTREIQLTVNAAGQGKAEAGGKEFFLELESDKSDPYVQEQIILTARVYQARSIIEGSLSDPQADGIILERLGNDSSYTTKVGERQYHVIERRYALFAQESGTLSIAPLKLQATVKQRRSDNNRGFFSPTQKLRISSNELTLRIKPKPADTASHWWLPAQTVSLTQQWNEDIKQARVGEPITRSINISAKGVHSTQLPAIEPPELATAKVYPDQAGIHSQVLDDSVVSYRNDKWAIIPRQSGELRLPELKVHWFDTIRGTMQEAVLPAQTLSVLPALNKETIDTVENQNTPVSEQMLGSGVQESPVTQKQTSSSDSSLNQADMEADSAYWWRWTAAVAVSAWMLTAFGWWRQARSKSPPDKRQGTNAVTATATASLKAVEQSCQAGDAGAVSRSLLQWGSRQWPDSPPRNLEELADRLAAPGLHSEFRQLDARIYSQQDQPMDFKALMAKIHGTVKRQGKKPPRTQQRDLLPEL